MSIRYYALSTQGNDMNSNRLTFTLAVMMLLSFCLLQTGCTTTPEEMRAENIRRIDSFTTNLAACDRVEVFHLNYDLEPDTKVGFPVKPYRTKAEILSFKSLSGADAHALAGSWRSQTFGEDYQKLCHGPVYGFRFYDSTRLVFETSLCFSCSNFYIPMKGGAHWWGLDAGSPQAKDLLTRLQQLFPASIPKPKAKPATE